MNEAAEQFERAVESAHRDTGTRVAWVVIAGSLLYVGIRLLPWALAGFKITEVM